MDHNIVKSSKSWAFREAFALFQKVQEKIAGNKEIIFATGYGPSGVPHIGTFGEVVRTDMVRKAFKAIVPGAKTKLIGCF